MNQLRTMDEIRKCFLWQQQRSLDALTKNNVDPHAAYRDLIDELYDALSRPIGRLPDPNAGEGRPKRAA